MGLSQLGALGSRLSGLIVGSALYTAVTIACQAVWLRRILTDLRQEQKKATVIFCENKSTITLSKNPIQQRCWNKASFYASISC